MRFYCRLVKERRLPVAAYSLFADFQGRRRLHIEVGGGVWLEELGEESFEQRVAGELLTLGHNKYSGCRIKAFMVSCNEPISFGETHTKVLSKR